MTKKELIRWVGTIEKNYNNFVNLLHDISTRDIDESIVPLFDEWKQTHKHIADELEIDQSHINQVLNEILFHSDIIDNLLAGKSVRPASVALMVLSVLPDGELNFEINSLTQTLLESLGDLIKSVHKQSSTLDFKTKVLGEVV